MNEFFYILHLRYRGTGILHIRICTDCTEYGVASNNLAEIFMAGSCGVSPDRAEAEKWYHKAEEQGFLHTRRDFLSKNS